MKVPSPEKLQSGNYRIRLTINGELHSITRSTAKECIREATLLKAEYKAGKRISNKGEDMTLREAEEAFIKSREVKSPSTLRGYNSIARNRFLDYKDKKLKNINWQEAINAECRTGLSPKTIYNAWGFESAVLQYAKVVKPDVTLPAPIKYDREWLDLDEILKLLDVIKGNEYEVPILLGLHSLRRSEICAMTYDNIQNGIIKVRGAVIPNENHKFIERKTNKTYKSARDIPIMIPRLAEITKGMSGKVYNHSPNTLSNKIKDFCNKAKITEITTHGLRHSFASLCFSDDVGMTEQEVMELGGWSDYQTVHKIYLHVSQKDRLRHKNKMAKLFEERLA